MPKQDHLEDAESSLTICSVSFHSKFFLNMNWELTRQLNGKGEWVWVVVENSPEGSGERLDVRDERFHVVDGFRSAHAGPGHGSYHHARGLNKSLEHIRTRFALFLDPDFYLVGREWIRDVTAYMDERELSFFGAPWHPKWITKHRYFPCAHCLFVDLSKVATEDLDFTPDLRGSRVGTTKVRHVLTKFIGARALVGISRDTGDRIFRTFGQNKRTRYECVVPVFRQGTNRRSPPTRSSRTTLRATLRTAYESLLPDFLSPVPKRPGYFTPIGFDDMGYESPSAMGWEEFTWRGRAFGFHLRGSLRDQGDSQRQRGDLARILRSIVRQEGLEYA